MSDNYGLTDQQGKLAEASHWVWKAMSIIDSLPIDTSDKGAEDAIVRHEIVDLCADILALIAETWPEDGK